MAWIDITAAMAAERYSGCVVTTASVDRLVFKRPVRVGDHLVLMASVNYTGRTSMEVGVTVHVENPHVGVVSKATSAYLTFVALDRDGRPTPVPSLTPETEEERRRHENAKLRVQNRKLLREELRRRG